MNTKTVKFAFIIIVFLSSFSYSFSNSPTKDVASKTKDLNTSKYIDKRGAFSVNIPKNWHVNEGSRPGQRIIYFTKNKSTSLDQAAKDSMLSLSISLLKNSYKDKLSEDNLNKEADIFLKHIKEKAASTGDSIILLKKEKQKINGYNAIILRTKIIEKEKSELLSDFAVVLSNKYIINLFFNCKKEDNSFSKNIFYDATTSFKLLNKESIPLKFKEYDNSKQNISLLIPDKSTVEDFTNKDIYKLIASLDTGFQEPVSVTITKIYNYDKHFNVNRYSLDPLDKVFLLGLFNSIDQPKLLIDSGFYDIKNTDIRGIEMSFNDNGEYVTSIALIHYKNNSMTTIIMESPTVIFEQYREAFNKIIRSLKIS